MKSYNVKCVKPVYQAEYNGSCIALWERRYACELPYYLTVNGKMIAECDCMHSAYSEYNEACRKEM